MTTGELEEHRRTQGARNTKNIMALKPLAKHCKACFSCSIANIGKCWKPVEINKEIDNRNKEFSNFSSNVSISLVCLSYKKIICCTCVVWTREADERGWPTIYFQIIDCNSLLIPLLWSIKNWLIYLFYDNLFKAFCSVCTHLFRHIERHVAPPHKHIYECCQYPSSLPWPGAPLHNGRGLWVTTQHSRTLI